MVQKTSKYYTMEFDLEEGFFYGAYISISNLPENIAWQTHKDELGLKHTAPSRVGSGAVAPFVSLKHRLWC
jgi:hypothetical protein